MRKLRIGVIDLVTKGPTKALWARVMHANFASIMPQVIGVWCEEEGHDVTLVCYTGFENLDEALPEDVDLVFIGAFSQAAQLAYALSNLFRKKRCYHRAWRAPRSLLSAGCTKVLRLRPGFH